MATNSSDYYFFTKPFNKLFSKYVFSGIKNNWVLAEIYKDMLKSEKR